jgi:pimeloyl-ACP methyl ester carboxylesterase
MPASRLAELVLADPTGPLAAMLPAPDPNDPEAILMAVNSITSILQFIWPLPDKGLHKRLYRVKAPTLLLWGAQDKLVDPAYGPAFVSALSDARLELIDGASHLPQLEQLEAVSNAVRSFLG